MSARTHNAESALICPECGSARSEVMDSRPGNLSIRRRRKCPDGHRYTTHEFITNRKGQIKPNGYTPNYDI